MTLTNIRSRLALTQTRRGIAFAKEGTSELRIIRNYVNLATCYMNLVNIPSSESFVRYRADFAFAERGTSLEVRRA